MKFHKYADLFPLLEGPEFDAFAADIKTNGLNEPITRFQGAILDGRNRWRACMKHKIKPRFHDYTGHDPLAFALSQNVHRRHLSESQRAMAAARIVDTKRGGDRKSDQKLNSAFDQEAAGKLFKVGRESVKYASTVHQKGIAELVKAVDRGDLAVSRAASIAKKPAAEQKKALQKLNSGATESVPRPPRGSALIQLWDRSKPEEQITFLEARKDTVRQLLDGLTFG